MERIHISRKELKPIMVATVIWGRDWSGISGKLINLFWWDNTTEVAIDNSGSSRDNNVIQLLRCQAFIAARFTFTISVSLVRGTDTGLVDALSRNSLPLNYPQADSLSTIIKKY